MEVQMATRNHYVVLGVAPTESSSGIRAAFRDLARRLHLDHAGAAGASALREATEAHDVLADPHRRSEYDAELRRGSPSERRISVRGDLEDVRPSAGAMFERFARNFTGLNVPKAERVQELEVNLAISPEEGERGTRVRVGVPVFAPCEPCGGRGCALCRGQGAFEGERHVAIDVLPMSNTGAEFVVPLSGLGVHNFYLRVRVRVDPALESARSRYHA
jgi:DnaJ-class molecular chaperone